MRWVNGWVASGLILAGLAVPSAGLANQQAAAGPAQSGPNGTELPAGPTHPYQPAGPAGPVELSQPWATPAPLGGDSNVMFTLRNYGDVRDELLHAACATAGSTELVAPAPQGGAPARVDDLALAPGQKISLSADGTHIVLHHLDAPARLGQTLHCTATFAKSGERLFEADVRAAAPPPAPPV